jgi:hypothetical protein
MKKRTLLFALYLFFQMPVFSQDSIPTTDSVSMHVAADTLLPTHYLPTQRLLWGEKGLMRHFDSFKLSEESRERELEIRDKMFTAHRYLGYATLAGAVNIGYWLKT